jgi:ATP-dependent RNA helicase RhlE
MSVTKFEQIGLSKKIVDNLKKKGIESPTPIQETVFQPILEKKSIVGFSKTGTGKTFAYVLPLIERLERSQVSESHQNISGIPYLVIVPTRELSHQVVQDISLISNNESIVVSIVGGESEEKQVEKLKTAKWVVATPGRLLDLLKRRILNLNSVQTLVFDEADRLLDMGFQDDMRDILTYVPKGKAQLLFFTATVHLGIEEMAYESGIHDLIRLGTETDQKTVEGLDHRVAFVGEEEKFFALAHWIKSHEGKRGLVFSNFRDKATHVAGRLKGLGCRCESLTAQLSQIQRTTIMAQFKSQEISVLIASDLAARGIDVFDLDFVVNYDLPEDPATYVHRVGRTARAGKKGQAISFVGFEDSFRLDKIEKFLGQTIARFQFESSQLSGRMPRLQIGSSSTDSKSHGNKNQKVHNPNAGKPFLPPKTQSLTPALTKPQAKRPGFFERILKWLGFSQKEKVNSDKPNSKSVTISRPTSPRPKGFTGGRGRFASGRRSDRRRNGKR